MTKRKLPRGGALPGGKVTRSDAVYVKAWRRLGRDVCAALFPGRGAHCFAFDPGLTLHVPGRYESVYLDGDVAVAIAALARVAVPKRALT